MSLKRRAAPSADYTPIDNLPAGDYEARLVYVADLGMQKGIIYRGDQKPDAQQISLGFEVIGQTVTMNDEEFPRILWSRPFNIYSTLTAQGKEIEYYRVFEPDAKPKEEPVWDNQLDKVCTISVVNVPGTGDKSEQLFDNISSVNSLPAKYHDGVEQAITQSCIGDADDEDNPCTKALFGLTKYCWSNRIDGNKNVTDERATVELETEDVPY